MFSNLFVNLFRGPFNAKPRLQIESQNTSDESVLAQDVPPRHPEPIPRAEDSSITFTNNGLLQSEAFLPPAMTIDRQRNLGVHVLYEPPTGLAPIVDIVFVHGLRGNSLGTWRSSYETGGVHWPRDLLKVDIPDARIISFGYDVSVHSWSRSVSQNRIGNHAQDLLGSVVRLREETSTEHLRLIFVMHSMGGLVVQNALDLSRSSPESHLNGLESNTAGLVFMGTPHFGSDAARWGRYYTNILGAIANPNQNIIGVLERNSEVLATIQNRFHGALRLRKANEQPILITCFYEELASPVVGTIVEMNSAILPGYPSYSIHADHTGMTKFSSPSDNGYKAVSGELKRWVNAARATIPHTAELQEECLQCLYFDGLNAHEETISSPLQGTFTWIWDTDKCDFIDWLKRGTGLYWITGRASSGKSTLMKYITTTSPADWRSKAFVRSPIVVSYFVGGKAQHTIGSTRQGIARALLWQLLQKDHRYFDYIMDQFQEMKRCRPARDWNLSALWEILVHILSQDHTRGLWIFLDGLDEFPGDLLDLVDACKNIAEVASERVRICVSSRPEQVLLCSFEPTLRLEDHTQNDITMLAEKEMARLSKLLDGPSRSRLVGSLSARANGLFMWVKLASRDVVRACMSGVGADACQLLERLNDLPEEITALYFDILRTRQKYLRTLLRMLGVVEFGKRNFTLRELAFILNPNERNLSESQISAFRRKCTSLAGGLLDYKNGRVTLAHQTVSSFLQNLLRDESYAVYLNEGCLALSKACLLLLRSFERPRDFYQRQNQENLLPERVSSVLRGLIGYSIQNWLHHLSSCASQGLSSAILDSFPVNNQQVTHWHVTYLAQYWDHNLSNRGSKDPVDTTLAFLLLSVIPFEIFCSQPIETRYLEQEADEFGLRDMEEPQEWDRQDLEFLVSVEFAPGYRIFFHAGQFLNSQRGNIKCKIETRGRWSSHEADERQDLIQAFLESSSSIAKFDNPVQFTRYRASGLHDIDGESREVKIRQPLFEQIQVVLWHCLLKQRRNINPAGIVSQRPRRTGKHEEMDLPTPLHYAAFSGLDEVVAALHKFGASLNHISKDSSFGTPLMAAIWGLSEKRYATMGNSTIETLLGLDSTRSICNTRANCASLGEVTPLNAAVKLYTGYRRRLGLESDELREVILLLIDEEAVVIDPVTRAIAQSSPMLRKHFIDVSRTMFSSWVSQNSPSSIPEFFPSRNVSATSARPTRGPVSASIGGVLGSNPYSINDYRLAQTVDGRFIP